MLHNKVRFYRVAVVWLRSWVAFAAALGLIALFWYGCYWAVATYAPSRLFYFQWGMIGAGIVGALMVLFNEIIVVHSMNAYRVYYKEENPKLWLAFERATPLLSRPRPRLYVIPERGMNAISFGLGLPFLSAVAATEGIIEDLSDDELAAVMAHEVGHVINKDILVSTIMTMSVMVMALTGWLLMRFGMYGDDRRDRKSGAGVLLIVVLIGLLMYGLGRIVGIILQLFVSRQREYAADATAARIIGKSRPLISALEKITRSPRFSSASAGAAFGFLCTADPEPSDLMATHPDPYDRITALQELEA